MNLEGISCEISSTVKEFYHSSLDAKKRQEAPVEIGNTGIVSWDQHV